MAHPPRKRRTVLWLFNEDYEFLENVAKADGETKNLSLHRLIRALRSKRITSFRAVESLLAGSRDKDSDSATRARSSANSSGSIGS